MFKNIFLATCCIVVTSEYLSHFVILMYEGMFGMKITLIFEFYFISNGFLLFIATHIYIL
jgi:hypothetical protein